MLGDETRNPVARQPDKILLIEISFLLVTRLRVYFVDTPSSVANFQAISARFAGKRVAG